jgi:hypothetical protein
MRIKEIMEVLSSPAYDPDAGFLRNVGRAGLDKFVRSQIGIGAYDDEELEKRKQRKQRDQDRSIRQQTDQAQSAAQQAAQEIDQAKVPAADAAPQTAASNTQPIAQTAPTPNFAQGTAGQTTVNAPTATVPAIRPYVPQVSTATTAAPVQTPAVNPAKPAQVYRFDGRALNPNNPNDARIITALRAQGVTSGTTARGKRQ